MSTFLLDPIGGNDANDGTTFANRWKTVNGGATSGRIAPGDTIRVIAGLTPTALGQNATWTNNSITLTLTTAVTANIDLCDSAWTASANVTCTASSTRKQGTNSASIAIAAGFLTGLVAYKALGGATDYSGHQQISLWLQANATIAANVLQIVLCSDAAGVNAINTVNLPAVPGTNVWQAITVDTGGALGASIQSVALYAASDPGTVTVLLDNVLACKASASADSLTLNSLIGKVHTQPWAASTVYAVNDIRRPTVANRTGYSYKVTSISGSPGNSGSSEPTWPEEIGVTVTDGDLTWTCNGLEEQWCSILAINGTDIKLDQLQTGGGYIGTSETVAAYKREPMLLTVPSGTTTQTLGQVQDEGTSNSEITFSGGWNRTDMSSQPSDGETWVSAQNGNGIGISAGGWSWVTFQNFGLVRFTTGVQANADYGRITYEFVHLVSCGTGLTSTARAKSKLRGVIANNCSTGCAASGITRLEYRAVGLYGCSGSGLAGSGTSPWRIVDFLDVHSKYNGSYGFDLTALAVIDRPLRRLVTLGNTSNAFNNAARDIPLFDCSIAEAIAGTAWHDFYYKSIRNGQVANAHLLTTDGGTIISATDRRNTGSGISWKFRPTSTNRGTGYPLRLEVARVGCASGTLITLGIYVSRDNANIKGKLLVRGGQIAGVGADVSVACEPAVAASFTQYTLSFTPTEAGVVSVEFHAWDGVGTTNNLWIDDFSAA